MWFFLNTKQRLTISINQKLINSYNTGWWLNFLFLTFTPVILPYAKYLPQKIH